MSRRPRRSVLFTPASRADRWAQAVAAGRADVAVADLEDAVAPAHKEAARRTLADAAAGLIKTRTEAAVRINPWPSAAARADLDALPADAFSLVVVPKVESAGSLHDLDRTMERLGWAAPLLAIVETAAGVLASDGLLEAPRLGAIAFGAEDYAASVGARRTAESTEVLWARSRIAAVAAAAGVDAIDQVFVDYKDVEALEAECRFAAGLGYRGKLLIHPDQVVPTHRGFAPTENEVAQATRILGAVEASGGRTGVLVVDGRMIDEPLAQQARRILDWTRLPD